MISNICQQQNNNLYHNFSSLQFKLFWKSTLFNFMLIKTKKGETHKMCLPLKSLNTNL